MSDVVFGNGDATLQALGGEDNVFRLVEDFYQIMGTEDCYSRIWQLHTRNTSEAGDRLARFLIGWMGGPRRYSETYGSLNIPGSHAHLTITEADAKSWLACMSQALDTVSADDKLNRYLLEQLSIPAQRIVMVASKP